MFYKHQSWLVRMYKIVFILLTKHCWNQVCQAVNLFPNPSNTGPIPSGRNNNLVILRQNVKMTL